MKGIILAGGLGTRLFPASHAVNKHLLPIYDKPMIYYPLSTLMLAEIRDILIITTPTQIPLFQKLLNDGSQWGLQFSYAAQHQPKGIAEAFIVGEHFIQNAPVCLILGDNIFQGSGLEERLQRAKNNKNGATLFTYYVENPSDYGVIAFDENKKASGIVEKPLQPPSHYAVTGLYFYDNQVVDIAKSIQPSARNELEISDINQAYLEKNQVHLELLGRGFTWLDMGTHDSMLNAAHFVGVMEARQGLKIGCPEEIAWRKGYIDDQQLESLTQNMAKNNYSRYLHKILKGYL